MSTNLPKSKEFTELNFPNKYAFRLRESTNGTLIFCRSRKNWVLLTPEEWVRQHCLAFYSQDLNISAKQIVVEKKIDGFLTTNRIDAIIYQKEKPFLLLECKATTVKIDQNVFDQIQRYNNKLNTSFMHITNGMQHTVLKKNSSKEWVQCRFSELKELYI